MERSLDKLLIMIVPMFVGKDSLLGVSLLWRKWRCWKRGVSSPITFMQVPYHRIYLQNPKSLALVDWELSWIAMGSCISCSIARHLITSTVISTEDDDALVYVKGYKKRE